MIPLAEARSRVLARCPALAPRRVELAEAVGCVTAEAVVAANPVPSFTNSAMDGYAVRAADTVGAEPGHAVRLAVVDRVAAGAVPTRSVGPGQATRIMTGAPLPDGADAVVLVERSRMVGADHVELTLAVEVGTSVRPAGGDVQPGSVVLAPGVTIRPAHVGVLASVGRADVLVTPRPRVGVISTGDELVAPGQPLGPGQIHDANRPMLVALVAALGAEAIDLGHVPDDEERLADVLRRAAGSCDVIVTSGGVSMGEADVVKLVLGRIADMEWMQIAIRPAKPFALGRLGDTPIIGLPGNPVSSLVSFELLARPGIRARAGRADLDRPRVSATAAVAMRRRPDGKVHLLRVVASDGAGRWEVRPVGAQGSHQLAASASADGLAVLPDGDGIEAGDVVEVVLFTDAAPPAP